jgi:hypothetical protein
MKPILIIFLLINTSFVFGQDGIQPLELTMNPPETTCKAYRVARKPVNVRRNSLYFELAGSGGFASFNYEWNFKTKNRYRWMLRTGISGTFVDKNNGAAIIFPVMVHGVYGKIHGLDVGVGQSLSLTTKGSFFVRAPISLGYRFEPRGKRIFYRVSYTPIVSYLPDFQWEHWAGASIGFKLKSNMKKF